MTITDLGAFGVGLLLVLFVMTMVWVDDVTKLAYLVL